MSLSGLARGLLLRPYLSLVHVLHSRLRSLDATPVHEEGCAQQLCRHGVRCRRGTKGVVSSPCEDIPSDIKETEAHLRTAGEVLGAGGGVPVQGGVPSPWRRKKWRATTPSIHLDVPDSLSVTLGNGGIWQQLGWSTVCVTSTRTTRFSHAPFVSVLVPACCHSCSSGYSHLVTH